MIEVKEIKKSFGEVKAVEDLSFIVEKGEIVGLLGPNGAGKTTTMRVMSGFYAPDRGEVFINGVPVTRKPIEAQLKIGYLPENNPLYLDMLVSDLLKDSAKLKSIDKEEIKDALDFAVKSAGISEVYNRPIRELSKGYKQRVGLAIALLHKPEVLIMDEPTEGLDPKQRSEIRDLIKKLAINQTVIISTHILQEVESLCTRMIIIDKGKKVADGSVKELSAKSKNQKIVEIELEGKNLKKEIKKLADVKLVDSQKVTKDRLKLKLEAPVDYQIQSEISKLTNKNNWVIWGLKEETRKLEDVFKELTK